MPQPSTRVLLAFALLTIGIAIPPAGAATVLSDEICAAPFVLCIPADAVRAHRGLTLVLHDDGAGHGVLFDLRPDAVAVRLRRGGETTELSSVKAAWPRKGGTVVVKRLPDGFAVAYDAVTIFRQKVDLPNGGRWGVVDAPAATLDELSLQPVDQIQFSDDFMRLPDQTSVWEDRSGTWRIAQLGSARYSANAFTLLGSGTAAQTALTTAGYWFWEDLTVETSVQPSPDAAGFGLGLACQPEGTLYLLRFMAQAPPSGVLQLVHAQGGRETVLAEAPAVASPDDWHRLALSGVAGRLAGALNGVELLTADVPGLAHGQIALWVAGPQPVAFDDIEAYSGPREAERPVVLSYEAQAADPGAQVFINDHYMQQWADERDQWLTGAGGLWHAGHYWGDVALSWEITAGGLTDKTQLHLCVPAAADTLRAPTDVAAGCHLELARTADGQLALSLREGAQARADKQVPMPDLPTTVTLRRVGNMIEALLGSEVVASTETSLPAAGKVGLTAPYPRRQASRLSV
ncbi:MAG: hypothetical protein KKI08_19705, partial [Armatimonadetes bacterium]|nr:hypothetical protein [Armatimonadota bacterium]